MDFSEQLESQTLGLAEFIINGHNQHDVCNGQTDTDGLTPIPLLDELYNFVTYPVQILYLLRGACMHNLEPDLGGKWGFDYVYILHGVGTPNLSLEPLTPEPCWVWCQARISAVTAGSIAPE